MDTPPPPPGFELVGGTGAVPPPPPGFEPVAPAQSAAPAPPPGFEPVTAVEPHETKPTRFNERQRSFREQLREGPPELPAGQGAAGADLSAERLSPEEFVKQWQDTGRGLLKGGPASLAGGIIGDVEQMGRQLTREFGVSQKTAIATTQEGGYLGPRGLGIMEPAKSPQEAVAMSLPSMLVGVKGLPRIGRAGKAAEVAEEARVPKPVEPAAAEVPPPPKGFEPVADNGVFRSADVPPPPKGFEPVSPQEAGVSRPRDLGAAASGLPEERGPVSKPEVQAVADDLNRLRQSGVADRAELAQRMEATPPEFKNPVLQEKLYHAIERPAEMAKLTPQEFALFEKHIQPMRDELAQLYQTVKKYGGEDMVADPTYVHRIAKGHATAYDTLSGSADNPIAGTRSLNRTTSALQGRKFFALQDEAGNRYVVSKGDGASTIWTKGKPTQMTTELELRPGTEVQLGGKTFDVKQATTHEIEANSPIRYHKSAAVNTADALVRMREVARNVEALDKFKTELQASGRARSMVGGRAPEGFIETKIPQLRGMAFEPKIAHAFDDFYKPGLEGLEGLRKINQFATASIFYNALPHIENVAAHWFTGRGWDWIRPGPVKGFATDAGRAIKEVVSQGPEYQRLLREGSGLVYGGVKNADFYQQMGRRFGMDIEKNWSEWKPVFDKFGFKHPYEATAWWYEKMRNVLWSANDMFMLHRVFELERKGLSSRAAIAEAEKHIPNYRIPSEVLGSRQFSRVLQEPALTIFSRYHYGMWKSYMNMVGDLAKGSGKERMEALGNLAALGVLMYAVYPAIDTAIQYATGDPNAKKLRRGSGSIPSWAKEMYDGDLTFPQFLGNVITVAPASKEGLQQFFGKDLFTGQDIGGPVQRTEHAAKALVSPYNTAAQMTDQRTGTRSPGRIAFDTIVGAKNTSERTTSGRERAKIQREKADLRRDQRPTGPISQGYKYVKDKVQEYKGP